jgi:hypothetical protein
MKAQIESTSRTLIWQGLNFRVWEGVSAKGVKFIALVNRCESADPEQMRLLVSEISGPSKEPEETTQPALERLGVVAPAPAPPTSTAA